MNPPSIAESAITAKINNLQALRAFAATVVAFFHTGYAVPGQHAFGSYGVDLFFVLSGYIMARICEKDTRFFLRRRLIRILPPYWTLTLLLFVFAIFYPRLLSSTRANLGELVKSLLFIPFVKESGLIRPILFVGWSLNYEMLFYLLIALALFTKLGKPLLWASLVLVGFHYAAVIHGGDAVWNRFLGDSFVLEFPLGALAYYAARRVSAGTAHRVRSLSLVAVVGAVGALTFVQVYRPPLSHPVEGYVYNLLAFTAVLGTSLLSQGGWDTRLASVVLVGDASYILYLIHPYCEYLLSRVLGPYFPVFRTGQLIGGLVAVAVTVAVSVLLHLRAERPVLALLNSRFGGHRQGTEFGVRLETRGEVSP